MKLSSFFLIITYFFVSQVNAQFIDNGQELAGDPFDVKLLDIDNDNDLDIIIGRNSPVGFDREQVLLNNGNGLFSNGQQIDNDLSLGNDRTQEVEVVDFNNDGFFDFIAANLNDESVIYQNNNGVYSNQDTFAPSSAITLGDYDSDGDEDLFAVEPGLGTMTDPDNIYTYQNTLGEFIKLNTPIITSENHIVSIESADLDNDSYEDLVFITNEGNELNGESNRLLYYRYNNIDGSYSNLLNISTAYLVRDFKLVDVDNDNNIDIVTVLEDTDMLDLNSEIVVYKNDGSNGFQQFSGFGLGTYNKQSISFGDLDGDGDLDAFVSSYGLTANNNIWENDGNGNFSIFFTNLGDFFNNNTRVSELGDLDNDGDLDVVVASTLGIRVLLNELSASNNSRPFSIDTIGNIVQVQESTTDVNIDLTLYFDDLEDNASDLIYTIGTNDPTYFSTSILGSNFMINFASGSGGPHDVVIQAVDSNGFTISQTFSVTVVPAPCENSQLSSSNVSDSSFEISWSIASNVDPDEGYNWYLMNVDENPSIDTPIQSGQTLDTMLDITNLEENTTYDVFIQTICPISESPLINSIRVTTTSFSCEPPTNVTSQIITSNILLSWNPSIDALPGVGYNWYVLPSGSVNTEDAIEFGSTPNASVVLNTSNYNPGLSYDVYVSSICSLSPLIDSNLSAVNTFTIPSSIPMISIDGPISVQEDIGTYIITLTSNIEVDQDVIIDLNISGTAIINDDFLVANSVVTIPVGFSSSSITITVIDDSTIENNESIIFDINNVTNGIEDGFQQVSTLIINDDFSSNGISFINSAQNLTDFGRDVVLGELDSNQGLDAFIVSSLSSDNIHFNNGEGLLNIPSLIQTIGSNSPTFKIALGDFDGQGTKNDVLLLKNSAELWTNNNGNFVQSLSLENSPNAVCTFDFNNDSLDDIILATTDGFKVYFNDVINSAPNLNFVLNQTVSEASINDLKVGYVNDDIYPDLVLAISGENKIYFGNEDGLFTNSVGFGDSLITSAVGVKDLNNDGFDDVVFANISANLSEANKIYFSDGISYSEINTPSTFNISLDLAIADFDNDGDEDIVFANSGSNTIWENTNQGFQEVVLIGNSSSSGVDTGDIDDDGDIDIIFANNDINGSQLWLNNLQTLSNNTFEDFSIKLYPNPVKNQFIIDTQNIVIEIVEVFNLQRQLVKTFKPSESYDIKDLDSGLYFVSIKSVSGLNTIKILKE